MNGSCGVKVIMQQAYSLIGDVSKKRDHNLKKSNFLCDKIQSYALIDKKRATPRT